MGAGSSGYFQAICKAVGAQGGGRGALESCVHRGQPQGSEDREWPGGGMDLWGTHTTAHGAFICCDCRDKLL